MNTSAEWICGAVGLSREEYIDELARLLVVADGAARADMC